MAKLNLRVKRCGAPPDRGRGFSRSRSPVPPSARPRRRSGVVAGGSGFLGRSLVRRLAAEGHRIQILTRQTVRPGTNDVWIADVGWDHVEEIDRVGSTAMPNFGWPCYEGAGILPFYDNLGLTLCESLSAASVTALLTAVGSPHRPRSEG